ncbi:BTB/POZ and MATH domain-containing protein 2 [Dichanthelium oligosanthes]|uniref:BTB/POZ and MATH domain-containing protein 2 n=1 Tax=Dichanthelium oligosanthes TaxID=888268 RepID=A0A1E5UTN6_9POAL|nr:BTB/POZ and MATH domain-containing protein 2 [Dichanthelium oligosanthes]
MVDSVAFEFKVDYEQTKNLAAGEAVHSDTFSISGHMWRINWYPRGIDASGRMGGVTMMVELMSKSRSAKAIVEASLMNKATKLDSIASKGSFLRVFEIAFYEIGWLCFLEHKDVLNYVIDGQITVFCSIMVLHGSSIPVPPSDIGKQFGVLLDSTDGVDVSFIVDGETFHAHRAVLAARSPVFRAELLGSMAEATMSSITLHDIAPATFRIMLWFMYTDALPGDNEIGDSPTEMFKHLLAAADRYALDRLKIICAQKLWDNVSVDTVGDALACAEMYNCPELKSKCIEFVVAVENFKKVVLSESFMQLGLKFPSIIAEVRERVGT